MTKLRTRTVRHIARNITGTGKQRQATKRPENQINTHQRAAAQITYAEKTRTETRNTDNTRTEKKRTETKRDERKQISKGKYTKYKDSETEHKNRQAT